MQEWREVVGYCGLYEVSNTGRVYSLYTCRVLAPGLNTKGYRFVVLHKNGTQKKFYVHRLVLAAFTGHPLTGQAAAHLNGKRTDNRHCNLVWATYKENEAHKLLHGTVKFGSKNAQAKLSEEQVAEIRSLSRAGMSSYKIAPLFRVHDTNIRLIVARKTWAHLPC